MYKSYYHVTVQPFTYKIELVVDQSTANAFFLYGFEFDLIVESMTYFAVQRNALSANFPKFHVDCVIC